MIKISEEVKASLKLAGIQDDDIRELNETGSMLIDMITARDISCELIKYGIAFKCVQDIEDMYRITLI